MLMRFIPPQMVTWLRHIPQGKRQTRRRHRTNRQEVLRLMTSQARTPTMIVSRIASILLEASPLTSDFTPRKSLFLGNIFCIIDFRLNLILTFWHSGRWRARLTWTCCARWRKRKCRHCVILMSSIGATPLCQRRNLHDTGKKHH